ncbi:MAG: hypothetical protein AAFN94_08425 [Pseudomonadota bacterium]
MSLAPRTAALLVTAALISPNLVHADLTAADVSVLSEPVRMIVRSADGEVLGTMEGFSAKGDRARLFLTTRGQTIFPRTGGKDIRVTTRPDQLTLQNGELVMDATAQRIRNTANMSFTDDSSPITIVLVN